MESETLQKITELDNQINGLWFLVLGLIICLLIYFGFNVYYEYKAEKSQKEKEIEKNKKNQKALEIIKKYIDKDTNIYKLYIFDLTQKEREIINEVFNNEVKQSIHH